MTHAVVTTPMPQELAVTLRMKAMERVDKVLLLRSLGDGDRLQLNFRARTRDGELTI